jgi:Protein of unknown function (DUF2752)
MKVINLKWFLTTSGITILGLGYILFWPKQYRLLCPIHALTGLWCPGCGSTRAIDSLVHGDLNSALHNNALLIASPLLTLIALQMKKLNRKFLVVYLALLIVLVVTFTILRNIPGSILAPL